jgi:hypothetical protein
MSRQIFSYDLNYLDFEDFNKRCNIINGISNKLLFDYPGGYIDEKPYYRKINNEIIRVFFSYFSPEEHLILTNNIQIHLPNFLRRKHTFVEDLHTVLPKANFLEYHNTISKNEEDIFHLFINVNLMRNFLPNLIEFAIKSTLKDDIGYGLVFLNNRIPGGALNGEIGLLMADEKESDILHRLFPFSFQTSTVNYYYLLNDDETLSNPTIREIVTEINTEIGIENKRSYVELIEG